MTFQIINDDCLSAMALELEDNSVDAIVTDPPYGISFMGKKWDYDVPSVAIWEECLRVLKPGGHLLAFAGTRTQHRMCCNIEDAGFVIKDLVFWCYGQGFPKSRDISKAIDSEAGLEREMVGSKVGLPGYSEAAPKGKSTWSGSFGGDGDPTVECNITAPATEEAKQWDGWGSALKPALEPITLARKPLSEKTIAANVLRWGTGGLNIGACRVGTEKVNTTRGGTFDRTYGKFKGMSKDSAMRTGRWPANLIHDGSAEVVGLFPGEGEKSAARFFYVPKCSKTDRNEGLEDFPHKTAGEVTGGRKEGSAGLNCPRAGAGRTSGSKNPHPTVKPTDLMRYLCRLITQPGGVVLDPFMGSGSTGKAAVLEGFDFIGIELEEEDCKIAERRIEHGKHRRTKGTGY